MESGSDVQPPIDWPNGAPFAVWLSHDVDRVRKTYQYVTDILSRRKIPNFVSRLRGDEPYSNFERVMDLESAAGVRSTFFFLEESYPLSVHPGTWALGLGKYHFHDEPVASAIQKLQAGGWEVGLHGSYRSYRDEPLLLREKRALEDVLGAEVLGIRQHYLNLDIPTTWKIHERLGLRYDASVGSVRELGFVNSRYHPYIPEGVHLLEIPLTISDAAVLHHGWDRQTAWSAIRPIFKLASQKHALISVLWHQRFLNREEFPTLWGLYREIIEEAKRSGAWIGTGVEILDWCVERELV